MKLLSLLFLSLFAIVSCISAQEISETGPRFKGGVKFGFNASQINGDYSAGYNKVGLFGGIVANAKLSQKNYLSTGIIFSQRGSAPGLINSNSGSWAIKLNFIEVPLIFHITDWALESGYSKMHVGAGLNYSRLIGAKAILVPGFTGNENYFQQDNLNWLLEATFFLNKNFGFGVRYSRGINRLYILPPQNTPKPKTSFLEHWITFNTTYIF
ncbi:MAG: outer membrane beta-barrel protein [Saprospiraceae bacterium]